jgi:chondroitin 4-sulfotransferase 11
MVWDNKRKIIFLHIPKTGGTSVEQALNLVYKKDGYGINDNKKAMQHYDWHEYKKHIGNEKYDKYYKFTISRNPYDKVVSDYFWLKNVAKITNDNFQKKSFDEYLNYCEHIVKNKLYNLTIYHDHFKPQHRFIFDNNNKLMINKILRFENFEYVTKFVNTRYNTNLKHLNDNKSKKNIILNDIQKNKIYDIYKNDFILLKYEK